jgi:sugar/nucleoside kinase (ribokinase family)
MGGTANFSSIVCARLTTAELVAVISKIGSDYPDTFLSLLKNNAVDIRYVYRVKRRSTRYRLEYVGDERQLTLKSVCDPITIEDFPKEMFEASLIYFGPIANEIPLETIISTKQKSSSLVALDIQGLIRHRNTDGTLAFRSSPKLDETLSYIDILKLDLGEARVITGASRMRDICSYLSNIGVKTFIITKSRKGSVLYYDGKLVKLPAILLNQIYNTTGAGDCFFGSFLMEYLKCKDPLQAIQFAIKAVSYLIGSPEGLKSFLVQGDIYTRIENFIQQNQMK